MFALITQVAGAELSGKREHCVPRRVLRMSPPREKKRESVNKQTALLFAFSRDVRGVGMLGLKVAFLGSIVFAVGGGRVSLIHIKPPSKQSTQSYWVALKTHFVLELGRVQMKQRESGCRQAAVVLNSFLNVVVLSSSSFFNCSM